MKIEVQTLQTIIELMYNDSLKKIDIVSDVYGIRFENEIMSVHVKSSEKPEISWIFHSGQSNPPERIKGMNEIEVRSMLDVVSKFPSHHFHDIVWANVKEWRRVS